MDIIGEVMAAMVVPIPVSTTLRFEGKAVAIVTAVGAMYLLYPKYAKYPNPAATTANTMRLMIYSII